MVPAQADRDFQIVHRLPEDVAENGVAIAFSDVFGTDDLGQRRSADSGEAADHEPVLVARFMAVIEPDQRRNLIRPFAVEAQFGGTCLEIVERRLAKEVERCEIGVGVVRAHAAPIVGADQRHVGRLRDREFQLGVDAAVFEELIVGRIDENLVVIVGRVRHEDIGYRAALQPGVIAVQGERDVVDGLGPDGAAERVRVQRVLVLVQQLVVDEAVLLLVGVGDPRLQPVLDDRSADRCARGPGIVGSGIAAHHLAFELVARLAGDDADRAAQRVLAVERSLRPAQHLDPLDVGQRVVEIAGVRLVDAVDEDADARLDRIDEGRADAADRDEGSAGAVAVDIEAGRQRRDFLDRRVAPLLDQVAAERRCRNRNVLQRLLALARRDDDGLVALGYLLLDRRSRCFDSLVGCGCGRVLREGGRAAERKGAGRKQHCNSAVHCRPLKIRDAGFTPSYSLTYLIGPSPPI